ncbi:MAG: hypothetical protein PHS14_03535 [Elusimicrobia bacterium]|nr:hypothetical protein [Elusimicrobiota bacterium]
MMINSILGPDNSGLFFSSLHRVLPEFFDSDEYKRLVALGGDLARNPGLLCAAFTSSLCRLLESGHAEDLAVIVSFDLIEEWSLNTDAQVQNYIITEIFENVRLPKIGEQYFKTRLGPASRKLYGEWMEHPPEDRLGSGPR